MDQLFPHHDANKPLSEVATTVASSTHHHDGELSRGELARDEKANIVPFRRASPANAASLPPASSASSLILVAPPTGTPVPDYARRIVSEVVARGVAHKNVPLAPAEADTVVNTVLAALELADLYRFSMGEPGAVSKAAKLIGDQLDEASLVRLMAFVLAVEDKENAHDPTVVEIVAAIAKEIATAATTGPIIWPDIAEAVKNYYPSRPSIRVEELPDGTTITVHLCGGEPHRDEGVGAAIVIHDTETGALCREGYYHEGKPHRVAGPAATFHDPNGTVTENWYGTGRVPGGGVAERWSSAIAG